MEYQKIINLIDNKIADAVRSKTLAARAKSYGGRISKASKNSEQNNSETVTNENDKEIPKERYISPEERQKITADLDTNIMV